jgi:hypothetical protein
VDTIDFEVFHLDILGPVAAAFNAQYADMDLDWWR